MQKINTLCVGYSSFEENNDFMLANCTCTLIQTASGLNIIVDTMTSWDGAKMIEALKDFNLTPADIHFVVCTHGHSDHTGCNYLFSNVKWLFVGSCVSQENRYLLNWPHPEKFELDGSNVVVVKTPGHTLSCVSVIVRNTQLGAVVGICGDLFERKEDIFDSNIWLDAGSENEKDQRQQRYRMAKICDHIIPGHGPGFNVTDQMLDLLKSQIEN